MQEAPVILNPGGFTGVKALEVDIKAHDVGLFANDLESVWILFLLIQPGFLTVELYSFPVVKLGGKLAELVVDRRKQSNARSDQ